MDTYNCVNTHVSTSQLWAIFNHSAAETGLLWDNEFNTHYNDVMMGTIASQITSLMTAYSTVYSDADQRKRQSSASLAFVRGIHRGPVNSLHKWPVTRKKFPFDDVIMYFCWCPNSLRQQHISRDVIYYVLCWGINGPLALRERGLCAWRINGPLALRERGLCSWRINEPLALRERGLCAWRINGPLALRERGLCSWRKNGPLALRERDLCAWRINGPLALRERGLCAWRENGPLALWERVYVLDINSARQWLKWCNMDDILTHFNPSMDK